MLVFGMEMNALQTASSSLSAPEALLLVFGMKQTAFFTSCFTSATKVFLFVSE
jgi:hypothetical protein